MVITKKVILTSPAAASVLARTTIGAAPIHFWFSLATTAIRCEHGCRLWRRARKRERQECERGDLNSHALSGTGS